MNVERQTVVGLKWGTATKLLTQATSWCVTLVVIRLLAPADYGLMALSAVVMSTFAGIAELGLGASLVQARNPTRIDLARVGGALILMNGGCALMVCLGAPLFAYAFGQPDLQRIVQVSSAQFLLAALAAVPESLAYREMRFKWLAAADIAAGVVGSAITLVLAVSGFGVWALVIGNLVGMAVRTFMLIAGGKVVRPDFSLRGIGQYLRFGGAWSASRFAWQLTYQADVLIAGRFLSQEAVGLYSVAVQLANLPLQKTMSILNQVAFPAIARLQEELPRMRRRLLDAIRLLGFGTTPALWGLCAVAPEFVAIVLGKQWGAVAPLLQAVALVAPLRIASGIFSTAMSGLGRADIGLANNLVSLVVFALACLCGVRWGAEGLAGAYAVAVVISFVLNFPRSSRALGISSRQLYAACRSSLISGLVMMAVVACARLAVHDLSEIVRLPVLVALGAVAYLGTSSVLDRAVWTDAKKLVAALRAPASAA